MVLKSAPGAQKETPSESPVRGRLEGVTHRACLLLALRFGVGGGTRGNPATNSYSQNRQALYIRVYRNKDFFISGFYGGGLPVWHMAGIWRSGFVQKEALFVERAETRRSRRATHGVWGMLCTKEALNQGLRA